MHSLAEFYVIRKFSVSLTSCFLTALYSIQGTKKLKLRSEIILLVRYTTLSWDPIGLSFILSPNLPRQLATVTVRIFNY